MKNKVYITASELGEYVYCKRVWWLRFNGYLKGQTSQMIYGENKHNLLSDQLESFGFRKKVVLGFISIGVIILFLGIIYLLIFKK